MTINLLDATVRVDDKRLFYNGSNVTMERKELIFLCQFDDSFPRSKADLIDYLEKGSVRDEVIDFLSCY